MNKQTYNVICLKYGSKYKAKYVNILFSMVNKNVTLPFNFFCITDDPTGIRKEVNIIPLKLIEDLTGWWYKLSVFKKGCYGIKGINLFLDLDIVIVNNIDSFFTYSGSFCILEDWNSKPTSRLWNSSIFRFFSDYRTDIWEDFIIESKEKIKKYYGDQNWLTEKIQDPILWPSSWYASFKYDCFDRNKLILLDKPKDAKIIIFHGRPNPHEALEGLPPIYPPTPWISNYWKL